MNLAPGLSHGPVRVRRRPNARWIIAASLLLASARPSGAADKTALAIEPGPRIMSAAEKALSPDPANGSEQGIILLEETSRDESAGTDSLVAYHMRAKIFTAEARSLADVELPFGSERSGLKKWWGVTIMPDGTARDLPASALHEQELARAGGDRIAVLKSSLAGVVPGCVIDVGWVLWGKGIFSWNRIELQRPWPVLDFRYRWLPGPFWPASFHLSRSSALKVEVTRGQKSILVQGHDLPPAVEEDWMPPPENSVAAVTLYYRKRNDTGGSFWDLVAKRIDRRVDEACRDDAIGEAVTRMAIPAGTDLPGRLRRAYDWMAGNIRSRGDLTFEQEESAFDKDEEVRRGWAKPILADRLASDSDLEIFYTCVARALGAEAHLVLASDRRRHLFDASLMTSDQFDASLVQVRAPGEPDDRAVIVDNGLGLRYGDVAWWLTGAAAFLTHPKAPRTIKIHPADAAANLSESTAKIEFGAAEGSVTVRWTRTGHGQSGLDDRMRLRREAPDARRQQLEADCGLSDRFEVTRAETPGLDAAGQDFRMECEGRELETHFSPDLGSYSFSFLGPWSASLPALPQGKRVHPVVFPFPRTDVSVLEFEVPPGFEPSEEGLLLPLQSAFGDYRLSITPGEHGYRVERRMTLAAVGVPVEHYDELRRFLSDVERADRSILVVRRVAEAP